MAWSSWQRLGEGFASTKKITRSSDVGKESLTVQPKESVQSYKTQQTVNSKWNPKDFLSSFHEPLESDRLSKDESISQREEIFWSDSSSEDEDAKADTKITQINVSCERTKKKADSKNLHISASRSKRRSVDLTLSRKSKHIKSESHAVAQTETDSDRSQIERGFACPSVKFDHKGNLVQSNDDMFELKSKTSIGTLEGKQRSTKYKNPNQSHSIKNHNRVETVDGEKQAMSTPYKWSTPSFGSVDLFKPSRSSQYCQDSHLLSPQNNEDINIEESGSECGSDDNCSVSDKNSEDFNMEDIATDESDDSIAPKKSVPGSSALSQERISQQVDISSVASSTSVSPSSQRVGASDWATRFQQEVVPNLNTKDTDILQHDSEKKKKRVSRKSLVGQLSRLINREKSTMRFWQHSSSKETCNAAHNQKSVTLDIVSMVKQFSLYVAQCRVILDDDQLLCHAKDCQLMLARSHADQIGIQCGNIIQLFPPWKQMGEGDKTTILCANQVRIVPPSGSESTSKRDIPIPVSKDFEATMSHSNRNVTERTGKSQVSFTWKCACRTNKSIQNNKCPAYQSDHFVKFFTQMALSDKTSSYLPHTSLHLHSVLPSNQPKDLELRRTILQSIQEERADEREINGMPPFSATILRVFRQKPTSQNSVCLSVLVQDASGMLALVEYEDMDNSSQDTLWLKLFHTIGKVCLCQSLSLVTRRTKDKDPSLFKVISKVWKGTAIPSTDSQDEAQTSQRAFQKIPSFCYILQCIGEVRNCLKELDTKRVEGLCLVSLGQVIADKTCHERFSFVAIIIDLKDCPYMPSEKSPSFFLYDPSCDIVQGGTTFFPLKMDKMCVKPESRKDRKSQMCLLLDISWSGDMIYMDEYSTLLPQSTWSSLGVDQLVDQHLIDRISRGVVAVPTVGLSTLADVFVKVSGHIVCINEDECYSWEECRLCGTELTAKHDTGCSYCPVCQREVTHPETRMSMEVNVLEDSCRDFIIKINLSQKTITSILPEEVPNDGYDMELVLGKSISATCHVVKRTEDTFVLYQVDI